MNTYTKEINGIRYRMKVDEMLYSHEGERVRGVFDFQSRLLWVSGFYGLFWSIGRSGK